MCEKHGARNLAIWWLRPNSTWVIHFANIFLDLVPMYEISTWLANLYPFSEIGSEIKQYFIIMNKSKSNLTSNLSDTLHCSAGIWGRPQRSFHGIPWLSWGCSLLPDRSFQCSQHKSSITIHFELISEMKSCSPQKKISRIHAWDVSIISEMATDCSVGAYIWIQKDVGIDVGGFPTLRCLTKILRNVLDSPFNEEHPCPLYLSDSETSQCKIPKLLSTVDFGSRSIAHQLYSICAVFGGLMLYIKLLWTAIAGPPLTSLPGSPLEKTHRERW